MIRINFAKAITTIFFIFFLSNIFAQVSNEPKIKVILSENLSKSGCNIVDYTVRTTSDQYGYISTYIGFTTDKQLPDFIINAFDKKNHILFQTDKYYQSNSSINFKNMVYVYHSYRMHIDSEFIKTIVIEKD